jgi:Protein of unknown function (DUF1604)
MPLCADMQDGWTPAVFKSSRDSRAAGQSQQVSDFLDDDERAEFEAKGLQAASGYDTFAARSEAALRGAAESEASKRHGDLAAGLSLFPSEALKPAQPAIGMRLLQKMGWRPVRCSAAAVNQHVQSSSRSTWPATSKSSVCLRCNSGAAAVFSV